MAASKVSKGWLLAITPASLREVFGIPEFMLQITTIFLYLPIGMPRVEMTEI